MVDESALWRGCPSQWLNLGAYLGSFLLALGIGIGGFFFPPALIALLFPLGFAFWKFLVVRSQVFELSCQRLRVRTGVINHTIDEVELYRVKDTMVLRPWWMRITGLSSIRMETSDRTLPQLTIPAIPNGMEVREMLRKQVEAERDRKRVREMDFDSAGDVETI
jgi:uncharacterized membrane protein YdbT with pleckstrin-like domain